MLLEAGRVLRERSPAGAGRSTRSRSAGGRGSGSRRCGRVAAASSAGGESDRGQDEQRGEGRTKDERTGKRSPGGTRRTGRSKRRHPLRRTPGNVGNLRLKCACTVTPPRPRFPAPAPRCPRRARRRPGAPVTRPRSPRDRGRGRRDRRAHRRATTAGSRPSERAPLTVRHSHSERAGPSSPGRTSTFRRPAWRRASPSVSRASSNGSRRVFESAPIATGTRRAHSRSAGRKPSPRFASVLGQAHTVDPRSAIRSSSASSACVAWMIVVRGPRSPQSSSRAIGRRPYSASDSSISRGCSSAWTWTGRPVSAACLPIASSQSRGTARTECGA